VTDDDDIIDIRRDASTLDLVRPVSRDQLLVTVRIAIDRHWWKDARMPRVRALHLHPEVWDDVIVDTDGTGRYVVAVDPPSFEPRFMGIPVVQDPAVPEDRLIVMWDRD
jgi:hypothetical protein